MVTSKFQLASILSKESPDGHGKLSALVKSPWFGALFFFLIPFLIYLPEANRSPDVDELYHVLAAQGVLADGVPRIADGLYTRTEGYTRLIAGSMALFGDSLASARLPALVFGGLLLVVVFLWTGAVAGAAAAWVTAAFLLLEPISGMLFVWARFYTLHALVFWLGAIGVYALATGPWSWPRGVALAAGSALAFWFAWTLQPLTLFGLVGIGAWLGLAVVLPWLWQRLATPGRRWSFVALSAALVAVAGVLVLGVEPLQQGLQGLWYRYRWSPLHSIEAQNQFWGYHLLLLKRYPTLWSLFPILVLLAIAVRPRPALFCATVFLVSLALLSFAGQKGQRYIYFALPFMFALWGIAIASCLTAVARWLTATADRAAAGAAPGLPQRPTRWALIVLACVFLIGANGAATKAALRVVGIHLSDEGDGISVTRGLRENPWQAAQPALEPWLREASVVVTTAEEYTLYYLGDYDVLINLSRLGELEEDDGHGAEFTIDPRTGRPVIRTAQSLALLVDCFPDGMILTHDYHWGRFQHYTMSQATAQTILERTEPVELPDNLPLRIFHWRNGTAAATESACPELPTRPRSTVTAGETG